MELKRLSEHIWYMPFETERDRPNLCYVKGNNFSLAIDAGHSAAHTGEFYTLLKNENLPLPAVTVLTHWHWDHTFGMHAVNVLCLANEKTNKYLLESLNHYARKRTCHRSLLLLYHLLFPTNQRHLFSLRSG